MGQQPQHLHPQRRRRERPATASATRRRRSQPLKLDVRRSSSPTAARKTVDIRTLPFVRFDDNEVHSSTASTASTSARASTASARTRKHPFIVRNLKIWDVALRLPPAGAVAAGREHDASTRSAYGVYHPNYDNHVYRNVLISQTDTEPFNRGHDDLSVQYGVLTVDGLTFDGMPLRRACR